MNIESAQTPSRNERCGLLQQRIVGDSETPQLVINLDTFIERGF
jgi:hypothetical protein